MDVIELLNNGMRSMEYAMKRAEEGLPPIVEINGEKLFCCAKCENSDAYIISREKVDATEEEKAKEIGNAQLLANALGLKVNEILNEDIDFKRLEWKFLCEDCGTISTVRTEVDRY